MSDGPTIWTIGHSTRAEGEFLELLAANEIATLADVRRFPGSRKYPHFGSDEMARWLAGAGVAYEAMPELGGRRRPRPDSPNTAWRSEAFRGYADYMATPEYREGAERLLALARRGRTACMCSEAPWWRCHRALIADDLKARGATVIHIMTAKKNEPHPFTSAAKIVDGRLSYGAE
jgi:uncharacterized protein (DUF488 family)